jgi:negative regulator of flagellin synthesis FlgM
VKVNNPINKPCDIPICDTRRTSDDGVEKTRKNQGATGTIQLSAASLKLQTLAEQSSDGIFDTAKVEEIKLAIAAGRFQVKPEEIADALISQVMDLLQSQTPRA